MEARSIKYRTSSSLKRPAVDSIRNQRKMSSTKQIDMYRDFEAGFYRVALPTFSLVQFYPSPSPFPV
jgi:hypothetical protein